jgi:hypothetical protein
LLEERSFSRARKQGGLEGDHTCYSWSKNQTNCFAEDTLRKPVANGASQSLRNKKLEQFDYGLILKNGELELI